ncbi:MULTISPECIES: L-lactate dehydrogenase (quinone) [Staphylococcus]|jgi:malate dehydrogenase (quinone)|uniref:Probable malate:quinone oxidoreductase n=1 Tax=Staphylococcus lugdunensis TaxID=28035 RepID=A0ABX6BS99_STALU|nr:MULTISPECIES: L-lactate dehydrogenase (quinone) [Staphylococcus]ADC86527.1 Malate:quinone oxidoreductase [Staphylococcus lugdunensis HKU09-01]ARJ08268.1 malate dehydrogenase (quinone) [Staphylococcus lugdunensis]ARJ15359.1 malate dehydrogenase (quinone) [Staphylococcus lugdunensis]ARJ28743.1 malate dehydrogenase (quinone) [Staphylococcus lugdunensis]EKS23943.1 malate dehydrogenase (acceptor) [Staphylococcus lugdunensis ACS-027-V-Sch2]
MANSQPKDVILIGAGVLSTTFGSMLKELEPNWNIKLYERMDRPALESSNERHNAGTGHAALCELNYTVEQPDGSIDIEKAKEINEEFEISKQFWGHLVKSGSIDNPREFINPLPHISFVRGVNNQKFLKKRYEAMKDFPMFDNIEYTEDIETLRKWVPLMMEGRVDDGKMAASKIDEGTDVNFGELTRKMTKNIEAHPNAEVHFNHEVLDFNRLKDGKWEVKIRNRATGQVQTQVTDYVFIGAGGAAIPLLQKTGIPESKHLGGFPITGQFLACTNPQVIEQHDAKVYGKEPPGTPPMTVPHLDARYIDGQRTLLFGPFANVGPKFLKNGSNLDLFKSIKPHNITTMLAAAVKNLPLLKYSFDQIIMTKEGCMNHLRTFYPEARDEDWELYTAGKRVQVIKDTKEHGKGFIQFGTEVVNSQDHTVIALLGESPGASTSVSVALEVLERNFPEYADDWKPKVKEMIPSYGESLITDVDLMRKTRRQTSKDLELGYYDDEK